MTAGMPVPIAPALASQFYLARQPILNRSQRLVAYELLFRHADVDAALVSDHAAATASVIAHASELGMDQVVGEQLAFVNVDEVGLMSDFIHFLPSDKVIFEILETVRATPAVLARVRELKQAGFRFALDDVVAESDDVRRLQELADVIKVDIRDVPPARLGALAGKLRRPDRKLLAEKVETAEEFTQCMELGFEYFQGYYFARPVILSGKKIAPSQMAVVNLLNLLGADAEQDEIERAVKHDALVALNLLRLVNTPAVGARARINSVGHALLVLGRRQLQRWLQILLYVQSGPRQDFDSPLLQLATTRGKTMELLMEHKYPGQRIGADIGFTVGIMSLMDTLFSVAMEDILECVNVLDEVRGALLHRRGNYGSMLALVEQTERGGSDGTCIGYLLDELDLGPADLYAIQLAAYHWVHEYRRGI